MPAPVASGWSGRRDFLRWRATVRNRRRHLSPRPGKWRFGLRPTVLLISTRSQSLRWTDCARVTYAMKLLACALTRIKGMSEQLLRRRRQSRLAAKASLRAIREARTPKVLGKSYVASSTMTDESQYRRDPEYGADLHFRLRFSFRGRSPNLLRAGQEPATRMRNAMYRRSQSMILFWTSLGLLTSAAAPVQAADQAIDRLLQSPVAKDWVTNGGNLTNQRFSTLKQIDTTNVRQLKGTWMTRLKGSGFGGKYSFEASPLIKDGIMYV